MSSDANQISIDNETKIALIKLRELVVESSETPNSITTKEVPSLIKLLDQAIQTNLESDAIRAIRLILDHPDIRLKFIRLLQASGDLRTALMKESALVEKSFSPTSGHTYVCPIDPEHYEKRTHSPTDRLICPLHDVPLVETGPDEKTEESQ